MSDVKKMRYPKKRFPIQKKIIATLEEWYGLQNSITNEIIASEIAAWIPLYYRRRVRGKKGIV